MNKFTSKLKKNNYKMKKGSFNSKRIAYSNLRQYKIKK